MLGTGRRSSLGEGIGSERSVRCKRTCDSGQFEATSRGASPLGWCIRGDPSLRLGRVAMARRVRSVVISSVVVPSALDALGPTGRDVRE